MSESRKALHVAPGLSLPIDLLTSGTAIIGIRGSGKTSTAVVLVEEATRVGVPSVVSDPTGAWSGLKSSADGKSAGLPFYIFGGNHADVPLDEHAGPIVARFVVEKRVSIVLDLSHMRKGAQRRFMAEFLETLYDLKARHRDPLLVVLDEVSRFCPQMGQGSAGGRDPVLSKCIGAVEDIVALGRSRGLGCVLIGQRPATINKNVLTQADNLFAMRTVGTQDRKAIDEWVVEAQGDQRQRDEMVQSLPSLPQGDAYFWSPALLGIFKRVHINARTTFDSSRTPKVGERRIEPTAFAAVDLEALKGEIAATIERAKADDPKVLKAQIRELEREIEKTRSDRTKNLPPERVEVEKIVEVPVISDEQLARAESLAANLAQNAQDIHDAIIRPTRELLEQLRARPAVLATLSTAQSRTVRDAAPRQSESPRRTAATSSGDATIGKGERTILAAIAQFRGGATRAQLTVLTGYKRSSRDTYLQRLRAAGMVEINGDVLLATDAGVDALGSDFEPLPTGRALQAYWLERLPEGERAILEILIGAHPRPVDRDVLSERTGYKRSSRDTYLQRLRSRQLIAGERGEVRAAAELFDSRVGR